MPAQLNQRPFAVMNNIPLGISIWVLGSFAFWLLLFFTYTIDRPYWTAFVGSSMNILLVIPPLTSYYLYLELCRNRLGLKWRVLGLIGMSLLWLIIQRQLIYPAFGLKPEYGENLSNFVFLTTFASFLWLGVRGFKDRARLQEALQLQQSAELRLQDSQLTPHTLFNMSNIVYAVLLRTPHQAAPLFLAMNQMLRYLVEQSPKHWTPAHAELAFMENYAMLERARDSEKVDISFDCQGDLAAPVPPMLLATLFENAVKHGRFPDGHLTIKVVLKIDDEQLSFAISNRVPCAEAPSKGLGIGLKAAKRRLQLLYPNQNTLQTWRENQWFHAHLEVRL